MTSTGDSEGDILGMKQKPSGCMEAETLDVHSSHTELTEGVCEGSLE